MSAPGASSDPLHPSWVPPPRFDLAPAWLRALSAWAHRDVAGRRALVADARPEPGQQLLDVGCGGGELALLLAERAPHADVLALDRDPRQLARALGRSRALRRPIRVYRGEAQRLPFPAQSVDRVFLAFGLAALPRAEQLAALREARRVLFRDGSLHVLDWAPPRTRWEAWAAALGRRGPAAQGAPGCELPQLFAEAGFARARQTGAASAPLGALARWVAHPAESLGRREEER